jgi:hypothetical protein
MKRDWFGDATLRYASDDAVRHALEAPAVRFSGPEQFAGQNLYDHVGVCLTCGKYHPIPKGERVESQAVLDWHHKHRGHAVGAWPYKLLGFLDELKYRLAHNADAKVAYAADAAYTCTLTGLATSSTLLAGRESTGVSNASNKYLDELVSGFVTVGTSPTANTFIEVHVVGAIEDTPTYPDTFDGTDSAETVTSAGIKPSICRPVGIMLCDATTSDRTYPFAPLGIRQHFGDAMPTAHVLWVTHSTGVNLNATAANHALYHLPVYATVA